MNSPEKKHGQHCSKQKAHQVTTFSSQGFPVGENFACCSEAASVAVLIPGPLYQKQGAEKAGDDRKLIADQQEISLVSLKQDFPMSWVLEGLQS